MRNPILDRVVRGLTEISYQRHDLRDLVLVLACAARRPRPEGKH